LIIFIRRHRRQHYAAELQVPQSGSLELAVPGLYVVACGDVSTTYKTPRCA